MLSAEKSICMTMSNDALSQIPRLASWTSGRRIAFELRYAASITLDRGLPEATAESLADLYKGILAPILAKADELRVANFPRLDLLRQHLSELRTKTLNQRDSSSVLIQIRLKSFYGQVENALDCMDGEHLPVGLGLLFQLIEEFVSYYYKIYCISPFIEPNSCRPELGHMNQIRGQVAPSSTGSCRAEDGFPVSVLGCLLETIV